MTFHERTAIRPLSARVRASARLAFALLMGLGAGAAQATHYQVLAQFPASTLLGDNRMGKPAGAPWVAADGTLYGLAGDGFGGSVSGGGLYAVSPSGVFTDLHELQATEGSMSPPADAIVRKYFSSLGMDTDGSFYGVTYDVGPSATGLVSQGTVFRYASGQLSTLHTFYGTVNADGAAPLAIAKGSDGNYYGVTGSGGIGNINGAHGVAFELTPGGQETVLYTFIGAAPESFLLGSDGNIYGSLPPGWKLNSAGPGMPNDALFKLTPDGTLTILYQFSGGQDGLFARNLIQGSDGTLYGTASAGGLNGNGTVFRFTTGGQFSVLHYFDNNTRAEGFQPGALTLAADGNLYGTTELGSQNGSGAVFRLSTTGVYSKLHMFDGSSAGGGAPISIVQHGARQFLGTAAGGSQAPGPSGIYKMTVPVHGDLTGVGRSSLLTSASGVFQTGFIDLSTLSGSVSTNISAGYYPAAVGDFNGDGIQDIIWTSANNDLYVWFGKAGGGYTAQSMGTYPAGWAIVGAGDIDGDGIDDLLWLDQQTNQFAYWLMNGATRTGYKIIDVAQGYYPAAIGDFDGDGKTDVMWTSAKRDLYYWRSVGNGFAAAYVTTYPANWKVVGRGDLDGDGRDDLVWQTDDGQSWGYWLMNGGTVQAVVSHGLPGILSGYRIADVGDYNGDGVADVLWTNGQNFKLGLTEGGCSATVTCTIDFSVNTVPAPTGQTVFNSGVPVITH